MLFGEIVRVAFQSIRANLFRACLTMLGIIIGVGAVIAMLAAGSGAQMRIEEQIAALGSNILTLTASNFVSAGISRDQMSLTIGDYQALSERSLYLENVVPELQNRGQFKYQSRNTNMRLVGTTARFIDMFKYSLAAGRWFTQQEDAERRRVVVVGTNLPERFEIEPDDLVGETIFVNGQPFVVVGVLEPIGSGIGNQNPDWAAFIPLSTAELRIFGRDELDNISVRVREDASLERAMVEIERVLRQEHKLLPGSENNFAIVDRREFLETQQASQATFTRLLASIAGVSLLVGGIGIMNIMLVSVTERTREIGIRMALGATRTSILMQFLVESVSLCLLGGLIGVGSGFGTAILLSHFAGWETHVSSSSVGLAFAFSVGVGLFFGIWPARRAAKLDPIEALRYE